MAFYCAVFWRQSFWKDYYKSQPSIINFLAFLKREITFKSWKIRIYVRLKLKWWFFLLICPRMLLKRIFLYGFDPKLRNLLKFVKIHDFVLWKAVKIVLSFKLLCFILLPLQHCIKMHSDFIKKFENSSWNPKGKLHRPLIIHKEVIDFDFYFCQKDHSATWDLKQVNPKKLLQS